MQRLTKSDSSSAERETGPTSASLGDQNNAGTFSFFRDLYPALFNRRVLVLAVALAIGGLASMTKTFNVYSHFVRDVELLLGGDWALHLLVSFCLGLVASWATPPQWLHRPFYLLSPLIMLVLTMVTIDELLQVYSPLRQFSYVDMGINTFGVLFGAFSYMILCCVFCHKKAEP